jgi:hypothetical protein
MLPFSLVQRRLRLVDGLLPVFARFLPGGLFPRPLAIAALLGWTARLGQVRLWRPKPQEMIVVL